MSDVTIVNLALVSLGADTISSLTENSENARKANAIYEYYRDDMLILHPWNFAIRWATLAQLDETPDNDFSYAYQLPTDPKCLKVIRLSKDNVGDSFVIENNKLYCDLSSVTIKYIAQITDANKFSAAFVDAFSKRLAKELAFPITGDQNIAKMKEEEYLLALSKAKALDSQEGTPEVIDKSKWLDARSGDTDSSWLDIN